MSVPAPRHNKSDIPRRGAKWHPRNHIRETISMKPYPRSRIHKAASPTAPHRVSTVSREARIRPSFADMVCDCFFAAVVPIVSIGMRITGPFPPASQPAIKAGYTLTETVPHSAADFTEIGPLLRKIRRLQPLSVRIYGAGRSSPWNPPLTGRQEPTPRSPATRFKRQPRPTRQSHENQ